MRTRIAYFALLLLCCTPAWSDEIGVRRVELIPAEEGGYMLSADFDVELSERLENVLSKGVPLHFILEFECEQPRWYWFDKGVKARKLETRLVFHALTRSYRLSSGTQHQNFSSAAEALRALGSVRNWYVLGAADLAPQGSYVVGVRFSLDTNQLPKPIQISALTNSEWVLASAWQRWGFSTGPNGKIVQ